MVMPFDPGKDELNRVKHGLALEFGLQVIADRKRIEVLDLRRDYGEDRIVCYGAVDGRVYVTVYTLRNDVPRIISVRKANDREVERYAAG